MTSAITDHEVAAQNRLRDVLREKTTIPALVSAIAQGSNALDAALMQLLTERSIDAAIGTQLDDIGRLVGITRASIDSSLVDADYRRYVRAKIWSLESKGRAFDVLRVVSQVINDTDASFILEPLYPAGVLVRIEDVAVSNALAEIVIAFLQDTVGAGIKLQLISGTVDPTLTFHTALCTFIDTSWTDTNPTMNVDDTSAFPATGTLRVSEGTSAGIDFDTTYTGKTATSFTGCSSGAGDVHTGVVRLVRQGSGLGTTGFPTYFTLLNGSYAGGATMTVDATGSAPSSGTIVLSKGLSVEETVTYTGKTPTTFTGCTPAIGNTHADNSSVTVNGSGGKLISVRS